MFTRFVAACSILACCCAEALGCPWCESQIGLKVRHEVFGPAFWENAMLVILPLPILLLLVALVYYWPTSKKAFCRAHDQ